MTKESKVSKLEETFLALMIGDYILDQETKEQRIDMLPRPFVYLRDKYLKYKLSKLDSFTAK
jgi:hypothetical protein